MQCETSASSGGAADVIPNPRGRVLVALPATAGVLTRRVVAYLLDLLFIALFGAILGALAVLLTIVSFGLLHGAIAFAVFTPIIYSTLTIAGRHGATWGMRLTGIGYRREDGGMPAPLQAVAVTLLFYFTFWLTGGLILLIALFSRQHRTLHDMVTGLVMIRTDALLWVA